MGFYNNIVMTLKLKEGVIMKNRLALASVICLLLVLTLSVSAYTPWGIEVVNDGILAVLAHQAHQP
jgi:primosomal replication protein N